jgi:hypothetical protein
VTYVASELSSVPAGDGEEKAHGDSRLPVREVCLEGLGSLQKKPRGHGPLTFEKRTEAFAAE